MLMSHQSQQEENKCLNTGKLRALFYLSFFICLNKKGKKKQLTNSGKPRNIQSTSNNFWFPSFLFLEGQVCYLPVE